MTRCLNSPWIRISPSFTEPPTPHLLFNNLPNSFRSFSVPMNPLINVTVLPPRPFFSILTRSFCCFLSGIKEQIDTITNRYNKWLYLFLNILFATCYHNNVYISFHFHMGMDHFFRVSYLLQRLLPLSYLVQNQLFE